MIDVDLLHDQLEVAVAEVQAPAAKVRPAKVRPAKVRPAKVSAPPPSPGRAPAPASGPEDLLEQGRLAEVDAFVATLAGPGGSPRERADAAAWSTMRALLDGREADARAGNEALARLGLETHDDELVDRYWAQRFWLILSWGGDEETDELLDHCRSRAYRDDDLSWSGMLTLLLARLGRVDEAAREHDAAASRLGSKSSPLPERESLDLVTNLAEAAAIAGDGTRVDRLSRTGLWSSRHLVVVGRGPVAKGATSRFRGLAGSAGGRWEEVDREFAVATEVHRRLGAPPLLARTLEEWGRSLAGRDDLRSRACLEESAEVARRLDRGRTLVA